MDLVEKLLHHIRKPGLKPDRRLPESPGQKRGDLIHRNAAGELPGHRAPHPVAHRKRQVHARGGRLPQLPKMMHLARIEPQPKKGVLVVLADFAPVSPSEPPQTSARRLSVC